jgi:hypothetical protein
VRSARLTVSCARRTSLRNRSFSCIPLTFCTFSSSSLLSSTSLFHCTSSSKVTVTIVIEVKSGTEYIISTYISVATIHDEKYPAYVVITDRLTTLGDLQTKARAIDRIIVRWEKLKRKTQIIQCHRCQKWGHRCQKWGHAATNCNATIKCRKCGDVHTTSECSIKKEDTSTHNKIKCANCAGSHLANSTDCRVYLDRFNYISEKRTNKATPNPIFVDAPPPANNPWIKPAPAPAQAPAPVNNGIGRLPRYYLSCFKPMVQLR